MNIFGTRQTHQFYQDKYISWLLLPEWFQQSKIWTFFSYFITIKTCHLRKSFKPKGILKRIMRKFLTSFQHTQRFNALLMAYKHKCVIFVIFKSIASMPFSHKSSGLEQMNAWRSVHTDRKTYKKSRNNYMVIHSSNQSEVNFAQEWVWNPFSKENSFRIRLVWTQPYRGWLPFASATSIF